MPYWILLEYKRSEIGDPLVTFVVSSTNEGSRVNTKVVTRCRLSGFKVEEGSERSLIISTSYLRMIPSFYANTDQTGH